ncbi:hypothetical protein [Streptomyces sp. 3211]|uniref:hypothetical protein n=1 Tax=Streptomyces sp. 3211 TaxID=1964449 RepID=UPI0009A54AC3|nr:hypothetical protein [Streptomyces sp. 3211]
MTRTRDVVTPDVVTLASLDTHRLIVTLPNRGPADVRSNLPRATAAAMLRRLADGLDAEQPRRGPRHRVSPGRGDHRRTTAALPART